MVWRNGERDVTREAKIPALLSYRMNSMCVCVAVVMRAYTPRKWKKSPVNLMYATSDGLVYVEVKPVQVQPLVRFKA